MIESVISSRDSAHGEERAQQRLDANGAWDEQFYPDGVGSWMVKLDVDPSGGIAFDKSFYVTDFRGLRVHQARLQGGDASSDSYCFS